VGAQAVFDFVGAAPTVEITRKSVAMDGVVQIIGIGGALLPTGFFSTPMGTSVRAPYWGTRTELMEVLDLARPARCTSRSGSTRWTRRPRPTASCTRARSAVAPSSRPRTDPAGWNR
jgi:hypothetical protein